MIDKQKYVGESQMKDTPQKSFQFTLSEQALQKIAIKARQELTPDLEDMQNQIDSFNDHGMSVSNQFGDNPHIGISQKKLTEANNQHLETEADLQSQINAIISDKAVVSLNATPSPVFVGAESAINLSATTNTPSISIKIKKGTQQIATGSGTSVSGTDTITPSDAGNTTYTAEFIIAGLTKTTTKNVAAVYPIRIGSGASYVEGTGLTTPKTSPDGSYNVTVANNGDYVYFNVPSTMTIHGATMNVLDFPLVGPERVTINEVVYNSYRSSNTYDAGTLTIVIY